MIVRGKSLIDQTSQRLFRESVDHGCYQGNHWNYKPDSLIQICSVDTLYRRKITPPADLVVIDEAHLSRSPSFEWVLENYKDSYFLPVSATPHHKKGLNHVADQVVYPISISELMEQGYLSKPRYFMPTKIDLSSVSIDKSTSDYNVLEAATLLEGSTVYGDILTHYKKLCPNMSAVIFAINVDHSKKIVSMFNDAGIPAVHVEADTPDGERAEAIDKLKSGELKIISNVGILTTGVDIPFLEAVILARPTKSYNLYVQMVGRGTRITDDKKEFFLLDHTNNIIEHGFAEDERPCSLQPEERKTKKQRSSPLIVTCYECYGTFPYEKDMNDNCPLCDASINKQKEKARSEAVTIAEAQLKEVTAKNIDKKWLRVLKRINKTIERGYKPGSVYYWCIDNFGKEYADAVWPNVKKEFKIRNYPPQQLASGNINGAIQT